MQELVSTLAKLRQIPRFTTSDWEKRGLNPSNAKVIKDLTDGINQCLDDLLTAASSGSTRQVLKDILAKSLLSYKSNDYDTEEREFLLDEFSAIGQALSIDLKEEVMIWMYGKEIADKLKAPDPRFSNVLWTHEIPCSNCGQTLTVKVTMSKPESPKRYFLGTCNQCQAYNVIPFGPQASAMTTENFVGIRAFNSEREALDKMAELKQKKKR